MKRSWTIVAALALAAPASANDSTAERVAGGLVLTRSADIDMMSEDLFISAAEVRVRYVFRNRSAKPVETEIAFPMPDRDLREERQMDVSYPTGFQTRVVGQPRVTYTFRQAMLGSVDHADRLLNMRVPLDADSAALDKLAAADKAELVRLGLAEVEEYDSGKGWERHLAPMWTLKEMYGWTETFPPGRDVVIEHRYRPGVGGSVDAALGFPDFRATPEGKAMIRDYCVEPAFLAGLDRLRRRGATPEQRIGYILTTGGNWRSPIGDFRLVVDKGAPGNLVSFCGEGVRKISPTRFEVRKKNWRPDRDLKILIVQPQPAGE